MIRIGDPGGNGVKGRRGKGGIEILHLSTAVEVKEISHRTGSAGKGFMFLQRVWRCEHRHIPKVAVISPIAEIIAAHPGKICSKNVHHIGIGNTGRCSLECLNFVRE